MKQTTRTTAITLAIGTAFGIALPAAQADGNPFAMQTLKHGYMVAEADKAKDGKCGAAEMPAKTKDGECAGNKAKAKDGKCGGAKEQDKAKDGKCAANKKDMTDDKSSSKTKAKDGKCGEGKCAANKGKSGKADS